MAPDLNSVPASPRPRTTPSNPPPISPSTSRRMSQVMGPPPLPYSPVAQFPSTLPNTATILGDNTGVGSGPGPLRHPRPLTAADLHLQLEKEQEAVVNRLTRELSLLRQQTASVASTTSSTSTGLNESTDIAGPANYLPGSMPLTPSRRHRSSSNLSQRSITTAATVGSTTTGAISSSVSRVAPSRDSTTASSRPSMDLNRNTVSRQNSLSSSRPSGTSSPSISSSLQHGDHFPHLTLARQSITLPLLQQTPSGQPTATIEHHRSSSISSAAATARYEEAAYCRAELETVKRENEALKRRIRELERSLQGRRSSDAGRAREHSIGSRTSVSAGGAQRVEFDSASPTALVGGHREIPQ